MGMDTHVVGFRPPDKEWLKMKAVYDACTAAKIEIPEVVDDFFGNEEPDPVGVEVDIDSCVSEYNAECRDGYEIHIDKIPKGVSIIRVYNSY